MSNFFFYIDSLRRIESIKVKLRSLTILLWKILIWVACMSVSANVLAHHASADSICDPPYAGAVYDTTRSPLRNYAISSTAGLDVNGNPTVQLGYSENGIEVPRLGVLTISVEYRCFGVKTAHNINDFDSDNLLSNTDGFLEIVSQSKTNLGGGWYRQEVKLQPRLLNTKNLGNRPTSEYFSRCELNSRLDISKYTFLPIYPFRRGLDIARIFNAADVSPGYPINKPYSLGYDCGTFLNKVGEVCSKGISSADCQGFNEWSLVQSGSMLLTREGSNLKIELPKKSPQYGLQISGFDILVTYQKSPGYTFRGDMWSDPEIFTSSSGFTGNLDLLKVADWAKSKGFNLNEPRLFGITPRFKGVSFMGKTNAIYTIESLILNEIVKKVETDKAAESAKIEAEAKAKAAAEQKAKQEAEAKAAAELKAKQEAEAKAASNKKVTITCVKGKLTKKVTAISPKCPTGYKKK
jgi:hypothetical protein